MNQDLSMSPHSLVAFLQKPASEFTKADIITYIQKNDIRMINFMYPAADGRLKTLNFVINNAAYELIVALTAKSAPPRKFELSIPQWDDLMIANIVENAINAIDERIGYYCHPFYHEVDKLPCYLGDRCDNPHCIFKSDPDYRKAPSSVMDMDIEERG